MTWIRARDVVRLRGVIGRLGFAMRICWSEEYAEDWILEIEGWDLRALVPAKNNQHELGLEMKAYLGLCRNCSEDRAAEAECAIKPCRTRGKPATAVPVLQP
ncbi:hypothetical protein ACE6H2_024009 [Prunus campanulata]